MKVEITIDNAFVRAPGINHHAVTNIDSDMTAGSALVIPADDIAGTNVVNGDFLTYITHRIRRVRKVDTELCIAVNYETGAVYTCFRFARLHIRRTNHSLCDIGNELSFVDING